MLQDILIVAIPVVVLIDVTFLVTWATMAFHDGYGIPKRITLRGVIIANAVIAVHIILLVAYLNDPQFNQALPLEKVGESMMKGGPN